jgi:NADPH:quinone reductase
MAGLVHAVGKAAAATNEFKIGDKVAAFHEMMAPNGTYAEYAVAPAHTVFKIPENITFEGRLLSKWFAQIAGIVD